MPGLGVLLALAWAFAIAMLWPGTSNAAERVPLDAAQGAPLAARTDPASVALLARLRETAGRAGSVRVIAGLRTPFAPQAALSAQDAVRQRSEIAAAREQVLSRLPAVAGRANAVRPFDTVPFVGLTVTLDELDRLARMADVGSISEDELRAPSLGVSLPHMGASAATAAGWDGAGQVVAVLDTGVDKNHPFLAGKVVDEGCFSSYHGPDAVSSLCPGGATRTTAVNAGLNCSGINGCDHGTHVAGIVVGRGGPPEAPSGVAPQAGIIAMQVFSRVDSAAACGGTAPCVLSYTSDQIAALERVLALAGTQAIAAVNMSLGGGKYTTEALCDSANAAIKSAIDNLRAAGVVTVVAAGNEGHTDGLGAPGCVSSAVAVGATHARAGLANNCAGHSLGTSFADAVACFSNSASFLDLLAPGASVQSAVPGTGYGFSSGTSMAAPHVAGAWALLKQRRPGASVNELLTVLVGTGASVTDPRNGVSKPRVQLAAAIDALPAQGQHALSVSVSGNGSVTSTPAGIACGAACAASFAQGASVTLTASPGSGARFTGWSGACAGLAACTVHMTQARSVAAQFSTEPHVVVSVARTGSGSGTVSRSGGTIQCGTVCSEAVPVGGVVSLVATPASGHVFMGWSGGACFGTGGCAFNAISDTTVTASFAAPQEVRANLLTQSGVSGAQGSQQFFAVTPPAGARNLLVRIGGGTGDADLYVRAGAQPTLDSYDCRPFFEGNNESCFVASPVPGATYHILLNAYVAFSGVELTVSYSVAETPSAPPSSSDITNVINLLLLQSSP